jgi:NAD-reducing hydrogenase large subunit
VTIPPTAAKLRRLMNLAQIIQSHALSFFHLSSPDLLFGWTPPGRPQHLRRDAAAPGAGQDGIRLRQFGQQIIELLWAASASTRPGSCPAASAEPLDRPKRDAILAPMPEGLEIAKRTYAWYKTVVPRFTEESGHFGNFPTLFLALVTPTATWNTTTACCASRTPRAASSTTRSSPARLRRLVGEAAEDWSYLKSPYYKPMGYPEGIYRVGPLARLNNADAAARPTPTELAEFRMLQQQGPVAQLVPLPLRAPGRDPLRARAMERC